MFAMSMVFMFASICGVVVFFFYSEQWTGVDRGIHRGTYCAIHRDIHRGTYCAIHRELSMVASVVTIIVLSMVLFIVVFIVAFFVALFPYESVPLTPKL
jgi:exosortase/archaeosortase